MTNRVAFGAVGGGAFGLKVSKPGYDVLDSGTIDAKLAFDSSWTKAQRIYLSGVYTATVNPSGVYGTVNFGATLSAVPTVLAAVRDSASSVWNPLEQVNTGWSNANIDGQFQAMLAYVDRIQFFRPITGNSRIYSYIVLLP